MIQEDYVSFETAKLLKEKGFDEECSCYYSFKYGEEFEESLNHWDWNIGYPYRYSAPTLQMAMKWLRGVKDIYIDVTSRFSFNADKDVCFSYSIKQLIDKYKSNSITSEDGEWLTYEEACEAAIKYCLENLI